MSTIELIERNIQSNNFDKLRNYYDGASVVVTGGASFIGSHLVDCLIDLGCHVRVIDDLSSGKLSNLSKNSIEFVNYDLRNRDGVLDLFSECDFVFHLAAIHGGRGFIETYKKEMLANLAIDNNVFTAAVSNQARSIVHASSACAYPINLQMSETSLNLLEEDWGSMNKPETSFADGVYGWTKLFGEYQLENFVSGTTTKGRSARIFTAYGDRENESHAAIALIAKAVLKADPYPIWGSGQQTRNFTYVADTVTGLLLLGSDTRENEFDVFNVGTSDHVKVIELVSEIFNSLDWAPREFNFQLDKPTGVASRASNNKKIRSIFGWEPSMSLKSGVSRTVDWYLHSGLIPSSLKELEERLLSR